MFDNTWKIRQDLCKAYKIYYEKEDSFLRSYSYNAKEGNQLHDIRLALAYALCRYFDFNYEFYYNFPFSYKWHIAYDYMFRNSECFRAYYKFLTEDNTNHTQEFDLSKPLKGETTDKQYGIIHAVSHAIQGVRPCRGPAPSGTASAGRSTARSSSSWRPRRSSSPC